MQENRRPPPPLHRRVVPPQHADDIVHPVAPPQLLAPPVMRQPDLPVVVPLPQIVAPPVVRRDRLDRHGANRRRPPVRSVKHPAQRQHPRRSRAVPLLLLHPHATPAPRGPAPLPAQHQSPVGLNDRLHQSIIWPKRAALVARYSSLMPFGAMAWASRPTTS